jgi:peroxiredoxin Q/BCP
MIEAGDKAPDVTLETPDGGQLRLADMLGNTLVLFFYPKDDTSGCTRRRRTSPG